MFQKNWVLAAIVGEKSGNIIRLIRPWPSPDPSHWASVKFTARVFDAYCVASVWVRNGMFIIVYICMICYNLIKISSIIIPNLSPIGDFFGFFGFKKPRRKPLTFAGPSSILAR